MTPVGATGSGSGLDRAGGTGETGAELFHTAGFDDTRLGARVEPVSYTHLSVARNTRDAVVVTFDLPDTLVDEFAFLPGQYLTLRTQLNGEELRRSYSICSAPRDKLLRVAIKKVDEGVFSSWANHELQPGQTLEVMAPAGNFTVDFAPQNQRHYVCLLYTSGCV